MPKNSHLLYDYINMNENQLFFSGTTVEELSRTIFQGSTSSSTLSRRVRSADKDSANLPDGIESLEGFVMGLYQEVFNAIIYIINRSISTTAVANNTIFVLDTPGFQVRS
jgi:myosin-18